MPAAWKTLPTWPVTVVRVVMRLPSFSIVASRRAAGRTRWRRLPFGSIRRRSKRCAPPARSHERPRQVAAGSILYSVSLTCSPQLVPSPVSDIARWLNRRSGRHRASASYWVDHHRLAGIDRPAAASPCRCRCGRRPSGNKGFASPGGVLGTRAPGVNETAIASMCDGA
jgi:hypothetical protein